MLVVAADAAIRRHIRDNVYVSGFATFEAGDRRTALGAVEDFSPHIVIADLRPGEEREQLTPETTSAILQAGSTRPRIIALTGGPGSPSPSQIMQTGADDYLVSPFCIGELLVRVDRLLGVALPPPRNEIRPREQPRLSDLLEESEHMTLIWVTLGGLEQLEGVGIEGHRWVGAALTSAIEEILPKSQIYWAGTERIAAIGPAVASGSDLAEELADASSKALAEISLPIELRVKVRAGIRAWGEGKATFIARVTGRLSHGALPTVPIADGKPATATAEGARSQLDRRLLLRELGGIASHR
ncbi:MAG: hypothetical protein DCC49_02585 [Acidobacteria bacterium]|nr:MAG: hypothetical protein DCC49_02585 [Acidobacteriota bacterium]